MCYDLAEYRPTLPNPRGRELSAAVKGSPLEAAMFDLVSTWRTVSDARAIPAVLARGIPGAIRSWAQTRVPENLLAATIEYIANEAGALARAPLSAGQRMAIQAIAGRKLRQYERKRSEIPAMQEAEAWEMFLNEHSFRSAIVGLELFAFTTIYFGYETYVARVISVCLGTAMPRKQGEFRGGLDAVAAIDATPRYWTRSEVHAARLIRNAHVHRSGRLTEGEIPDVQKFVEVDAGTAQVSAYDTNKLSDVLFELAVQLTADARAYLQRVPPGTVPVPD